MTEAMSELREPSPFDASLNSWSRLRVAVVEPYASGRDTICACIEELGHDAVGASSVEHAARLTVDHDDEPIDLLIIAHRLPWIDGWGLVTRLRAQREIQAIVVCGALDDRVIQQTPTMRPTFSLEDLELAIDRFAPSRRL